MANATDTDTGCFVFIDWLHTYSRKPLRMNNDVRALTIFVWKDNRNVPCTSIRFALYHFATFTIIYTTLRHTASSLKVLLLLRYAHISQVRKVIMAHLLFSWELNSNASERANERVPQCKIKRTEFSAPFGKNQTLFHEAPQCVCVWQIRVKTETTRTVRKCIHKNKLCHKIP